jgi:hypothetical protein
VRVLDLVEARAYANEYRPDRSTPDLAAVEDVRRPSPHHRSRLLVPATAHRCGLRRWEDWVPVAAFGTSTADQTEFDPSNVTDVTMVPAELSKDLGFC